MKIKCSVIYLFLLGCLISCGKEQFGTTPQTNTSQATPVKQFAQDFCAKPTEIAPKVDILYLVDNSLSTYYFPEDIKAAIRNTVTSISQDFDYRLIGTSIIPIDDTPYNDYQILTNSQDSLEYGSSNIIRSVKDLNFFTTKSSKTSEAGSRRAIDFINNNRYLFRQNSNLLIILFSNGRDEELEIDLPYKNGETKTNATAYQNRITELTKIKTDLNSSQLRFISLTAHTNDCKPPEFYSEKCDPKTSTRCGWLSSEKSYVKLSKELYNLAGAKDAPVAQDSYNLCLGVSNVFAPVNASIKKVVLQNTYRYWPITFAKDTDDCNSFGNINVYKVEDGSSELIDPSARECYKHTENYALNTREPPSPGGEASGKLFIRFQDSALIKSPTCVRVTSTSRTEYFGYILLNQEPKPETIVLRINGNIIPKSIKLNNSWSNGWEYKGRLFNTNIKIDLPEVKKTGFMLQLHGTSNYYKSGDSVEVNFIAAPL
jgi:hypothetical protein